jgi:hypothetical protein
VVSNVGNYEFHLTSSIYSFWGENPTILYLPVFIGKRQVFMGTVSKFPSVQGSQAQKWTEKGGKWIAGKTAGLF